MSSRWALNPEATVVRNSWRQPPKAEVVMQQAQTKLVEMVEQELSDTRQRLETEIRSVVDTTMRKLVEVEERNRELEAEKIHFQERAAELEAINKQLEKQLQAS